MMTQRQAVTIDPESRRAVTTRRANPEDAAACGRICFEAFRTIAAAHNFPPDFPSVDIPTQVLSMMFSHPSFYCLVAESNGQILGSNCLDERSTVAGVGPVTIDPAAQNRGVGRILMEGVLMRAKERGFPGIRLLQSAYHSRSLSLYAKLGFEVREPISTMQGAPVKKKIEGYNVRLAQQSDLATCNSLCCQVHGHDRSRELVEAIERGAAIVAEYQGRITAYATGMAYFAHAVGQTNRDLIALIVQAEIFEGPGILVPNRNAELFRWCLEHGLRVVQPMALMTIGLYNQPAGAYLPSVLF